MKAPKGKPKTALRVIYDVYSTFRKKISLDTLGALVKLVPFGNLAFGKLMFAKYTVLEASNQLFLLQ